jgi:hypothetical protein
MSREDLMDSNERRVPVLTAYPLGRWLGLGEVSME